MKKHVITISIITVLLVSIIFTGCKSGVLESVESASESSVQSDNQSQETQEVKTFVVMSISPEEVYRIITEGKDHFLLDVRTEEEYNDGHIEGAYLIPVQELENRLNEIPVGKQIIVYCRSGNRSRTAANILMENGFGMVYDMGGIVGWIEKGYPVVVEKEADAKFEEITVDEAYQVFTGDKDYLFIDVRSEDEYNTMHIEGAINIPVSAIYSRLGEIPKDSLIIVYCDGSSCGRSSNAASILIDSGYTQIFNLVGKGIHEWVEKGYPKVENIS